MAAGSEKSTKRTIRRHQLREMVPLADSTIYEMEQRGVETRYHAEYQAIVERNADREMDYGR